MTSFTPVMSVDVTSASLDLAHETEQSTCPPRSHLFILWERRKKDGPERSRKHVLKRSGQALSGFLDDHTEEVGEPEINIC